jgi:hypothetical protein
MDSTLGLATPYIFNLGHRVPKTEYKGRRRHSQASVPARPPRIFLLLLMCNAWLARFIPTDAIIP